MASFVTPKKNTAYECYVALVSQANTKIVQISPTMAAGDVKVSTDNGTSSNITTLPVIGTNTRVLKVNLSAAEMNGDNVTVIFSDAAGAEWCDLVLNIQTSARQIDDLATPTNITAGTINTVTNLTNLPAITANWLTAAGTAADFTTEIQAGLATAAALAAVDGIVDDILLDTAEIGAAGAGLTNINLPNQTMDIVGNITGNLSGSVGSVTGLTTSTIADKILARTISGGADGGRTVTSTLRAIRNKVAISGGTMTVYEEDDTTTAYTAAVTTAAGDPISSIDPT